MCKEDGAHGIESHHMMGDGWMWGVYPGEGGKLYSTLPVPSLGKELFCRFGKWVSVEEAWTVLQYFQCQRGSNLTSNFEERVKEALPARHQEDRKWVWLTDHWYPLVCIIVALQVKVILIIISVTRRSRSDSRYSLTHLLTYWLTNH